MRNFSQRIIDHFSHPRNLGELSDADVIAEVANPCCGDRLRLYVRVLDGRITECSYLAYGCAPLMAIGSLLTESIAGRDVEELADFDEERLEELAGGLRPSQRHCAVLAKDVLHALLEQYRAACPEGELV